MRVLLLGGSGQVGIEIRALAPSFGVEIVAPSRELLDITSVSMLKEFVVAAPWAAVINAAAYTDVDRAESEVDTAYAINANALHHIGFETARKGIPVIHISTDYVFNGRKGEPYVEDDVTNPLNVYGQSKLVGEQYLRGTNARHIIMRSSWIYSPHRKNFVKTILRLANERDKLNVVADQRGCPTSATDIASACLLLAKRFDAEKEGVPFGTYHFAGAGDATWFDFAVAIISHARSHLAHPPEVVAITTAEYPTAAVRPADTRLNCNAIERAFGLKSRPWRQALAGVLNQLLHYGVHSGKALL